VRLAVRERVVEAIVVVEEEWSLPRGFYSKPRSEGGNWHVVVIDLESFQLVAKTETTNLEIPKASPHCNNMLGLGNLGYSGKYISNPCRHCAWPRPGGGGGAGEGQIKEGKECLPAALRLGPSGVWTDDQNMMICIIYGSRLHSC
jgi:hypothetical protein